jgi:quercetin dioxygenase-like cupin family protein/DNA-binding XRE family transcriptional regulator
VVRVDIADSEDVDLLVARRLQALRRERGVTLSALAAQTGISAAHLSRLEKGERQPSIAALLHLARVYGVPVSTLVDDHDDGNYHVIRSADAVTHHGHDGEYTVLSGARAALAVVRLHLCPGQRSENVRHAGEEWLHVLAGTVTLTLAGEQLTLGEADSVHFDSSLIHQLSTTGPDPATVLIASTSATAPLQHPLPPRAKGPPPD